MPKKTTKDVKLTDLQMRVLRERFTLHQIATLNFQRARWWNRKRRYAKALETYGVVNHMVLLLGGEGAVLDMTSGEPKITRA